MRKQKGDDRMAKRILSLYLIFAVLMGFNVSYAQSMQSEKNDSSIILLKNLGLDELDADKSEEKLTRAELAYLAYSLKFGGIKLSEYQSGSVSFSDVSTATEFGVYINMSYDAKLMYGTGDGVFLPYEDVSMNDIITVFLRVAGYGPVISYIKNIADIPQAAYLLDGVSIKDSASITLGEAALIAVNALDIEVMFEENMIVSDENNTVLNEYFGLYYKDGIYYTGKAAEASDMNIMLDNKLYETSDILEYEELNGYKVRAYIDLDDNIVQFIDGKKFKNYTYVVEAEDFISVSDDYIYFYNENNNRDSISLNGITEIYNGVGVDFEANDFSFDNGRIVFVAPNGGDYTTARIERYETLVAGAVSEDIVYDYFNPAIKLDLSKKTAIFLEGKEILSSDIQKNDVLSVARTKDERKTTVYVSRRSTAGTVTQISEDSFEIDGRKIYRTRYFVQNQTELLTGSSVVIAVDYFGRAAAVIKQRNDNFIYGYMAKIFASEAEADVPVLRIYQSDGKFYTYEVSKGITVNGKSVKNASIDTQNDFMTAMKTRVSIEDGKVTETVMSDYVAQLIKFKVGKDGKITNIDTAIQNSNETEANLKLHGSVENVGFRSGANQLSYSYIIDSGKTAAFYVPDSALNTFDDLGRVDNGKRNSVSNDAFRLANASIFQSGTKYNADGYDVTDGGVAGALIIDNVNAASANMIDVDAESAVVVIEKVVETLNIREELSYGVTYWQNGKQKYNVVAYPKEFLKDLSDPTSVPKAGDVLQLSIDLDNEINGFAVRYDNENNVLNTGWDNCQCFVGYCYSYDDTGIIMTQNADGTGEKKIFASIYLLDNTYVYNAGDGRIKSSVRKGGLFDLRSFRDYITESSKIFVRGTYSNPSTLVIYE